MSSQRDLPRIPFDSKKEPVMYAICYLFTIVCLTLVFEAVSYVAILISSAFGAGEKFTDYAYSMILGWKFILGLFVCALIADLLIRKRNRRRLVRKSV
jgi:ABC-type transport system involved in multi-copper enzyme maturation permease subunit